MITIITEKPSVAMEIARIVGARSRKDGYMEGNGYQVTWTYGHKGMTTGAPRCRCSRSSSS